MFDGLQWTGTAWSYKGFGRGKIGVIGLLVRLVYRRHSDVGALQVMCVYSVLYMHVKEETVVVNGVWPEYLEFPILVTFVRRHFITTQPCSYISQYSASQHIQSSSV